MVDKRALHSALKEIQNALYESNFAVETICKTLEEDNDTDIQGALETIPCALDAVSSSIRSLLQTS